MVSMEKKSSNTLRRDGKHFVNMSLLYTPNLLPKCGSYRIHANQGMFNSNLIENRKEILIITHKWIIFATLTN